MTSKKKIVVLAAGKGKRMNSGDIPKVLIPFHGKPIVTHLLEAIRDSGVDEKPLIVVGTQRELVENTLGDGYEYVYQKELLGTGHAVSLTKEILQGRAEAVLVLYGDHPFIHAKTLRALAELFDRTHPTIAMCTTEVPDFLDWRAPFENFSRIVRDTNGTIIRTVERKDATDEELAIREVNPVFICFDANWLWGNIGRLGNENAQKEYYLTDLIELAIREDKDIQTLPVDPRECIGVNTQEDLRAVDNLIV